MPHQKKRFWQVLIVVVLPLVLMVLCLVAIYYTTQFLVQEQTQCTNACDIFGGEVVSYGRDNCTCDVRSPDGTLHRLLFNDEALTVFDE